MNETAMPAAGSRQRLPNRRYSENRKPEYPSATSHVTSQFPVVIKNRALPACPACRVS